MSKKAPTKPVSRERSPKGSERVATNEIAADDVANCGMSESLDSYVHGRQRFEEGFEAGKRESSDHKLSVLRRELAKAKHQVLSYEGELKAAQADRDSIMQRIELLREELGF